MASGLPAQAALRPARCEALLAPYCGEVLRQRNRVLRGAGVEPVHDLRVASRRLQEILAFLTPFLVRDPRRKLQRRARRIRRCLGPLRNADVMVGLASSAMRHLSAREKSAFQPFLSRLRAEAGTLRQQARRGAELPIPGIRKRIYRLLRELPVVEPDSMESRASAFLAERTRRLSLALSEARRGGPTVMHRLRISVKRYRYAQEIVQKLGRKPVTAEIEEARRLQGELGRLHDLDVLLRLLGGRQSSPELERLVLHLRGERSRQLEKARGALRGARHLMARLSALESRRPS